MAFGDEPRLVKSARQCRGRTSARRATGDRLFKGYVQLPGRVAGIREIENPVTQALNRAGNSAVAVVSTETVSAELKNRSHAEVGNCDLRGIRRSSPLTVLQS